MSRLPDRPLLVTLAVLGLLIAGLLLILHPPTNPYAQLLHRARMHADRSQRTAAVDLYGEAARLQPEDALPYLELAQVYLNWGRYDEALNAVSEAERRTAEAAELERLRVRIHARSAEAATKDRLSHWEAAVDHGERLLKLAPGDREARKILARAHLELRDWRAARSIYEQLLASDPTDETTRERLGALLLGDEPVAFEHLRVSGTDLSQRLLAVLEEGSAPDEPAYVHTLIGRVLVERQEWALAARQLERAVRRHPGYADAHAYLGHALDRMGYRAVARSHLLEAIRLAPASAVAHTFLGLHYDRCDSPAAARAEYETAYDLAPDNPAICVEIGQTWAAEGRYVAAEIWLRQAVSLRPSDPAMWEILARFYLEHNITSNDCAVEVTERLLQLAPQSAQAHHLRGWAAFQVGRYRTAETHLQRAIELDAALASAHYHLGLLRRAQGEAGAAERAFQRAIDLDTTQALVPLVERAR
jgi:tetratricopeptide (TPR) repeat protein